METDNYYIQRCKILGESAAGKGNPPVGALILQDGDIISEAEETSKTKKDITCHAEIEAIRLALEKLNTVDLSGCTLFTTHEPCVMCSYAIRFYKIKKVVFKNAVNYLGGITSSMPVLLSKEVPPHWGPPPEIVHLDI